MPPGNIGRGRKEVEKEEEEKESTSLLPLPSPPTQKKVVEAGDTAKATKGVGGDDGSFPLLPLQYARRVAGGGGEGFTQFLLPPTH